jgi:hypothetical protein
MDLFLSLLIGAAIGGFALGYGVREAISRHRRAKAERGRMIV